MQNAECSRAFHSAFCILHSAFIGTALIACLTACNAQKPSVKTQTATAKPAASQRVLRVCADPNNLPYSNERGEGFENKIATLVARDLGAHLSYTWWPQRRGFVRNTLRSNDCDVVIGVPANFDLAQPTAPYYRSTYVFVARKDRHLALDSLDDPRLKTMKIGVQLAGDEGSPPVYALAARKLAQNMRGFTPYGDYSRPEPAREIIEAVAKGDVDVAIVWGPQAGWFARESRVPLELRPVTPQIDPPYLPFVFDISMAVRRGDNALREQLEREIERRRPEFERILDAYGVPRV